MYIFLFSSQAKKAREQAALKNAQSLFDELDAEKEKKEIKKKAAARRRSRRKERKRKEQQEKAAVRGTSKLWGRQWSMKEENLVKEKEMAVFLEGCGGVSIFLRHLFPYF